MTIFWAIIRHELKLTARQPGDLLLIVSFFLLTTSLFPLAVGAEPNLLARIAPGIIWVTALLSVLLSLPRLWEPDYNDGSIEILMLSALPLELIVLAKVLVHWLLTALPLALLTPLVAVMFQLDFQALPLMVGSLLLGVAALSLLGSIGAALALGARSGTVLVALISLPLFIPILIFGVSIADMALMSLPSEGAFLILAALTLFALPVGILGTAWALRLAVSN
jgi:heme exporter protein B